jgi:DNA-binding PadR family transcriptional regulator
MRPLGNVQRGVLASLAREPYPGGWYWQNRSVTLRALESLVRRGLAVRSERTDAIGRTYQSYRISDAGRQALEET